MYSNDTIGEFILLRSEGWSIARISEHLDISCPTLIKWNHEFRFAIKSLRAVQLEALHEKILSGHHEDMARLAKHQKAIEKELSKRKLSSVSTERLFQLDALLRDQIKKARADALLIEEDSGYIPDPEHPLARFLNKTSPKNDTSVESSEPPPPPSSETKAPENHKETINK
jgi:hypothetical protein